MLMLLIVCSGCSTLSRAGYGDRGTFNDGVFTTRFDQDLGVTYHVAVKALAALDATVLGAAKEESHAWIKAARPRDKVPIQIVFMWRRNDTTGATVKVGQSGDEIYSQTVVAAINEGLNEWHRQHEYDLNSTQQGRTVGRY
jgi:hypothetical protein